MKRFALVLALGATPVYAQSANGTGVRQTYDELMKDSGKWDFLSTSFFVLGAIAGTGSYYAYNRGQTYREIGRIRELTPHEAEEQKMWRGICDNAGYGAATLIGIGFMGLAVELHYENRAHQFALDMGVKF